MQDRSILQEHRVDLDGFIERKSLRPYFQLESSRWAVVNQVNGALFHYQVYRVLRLSIYISNRFYPQYFLCC